MPRKKHVDPLPEEFESYEDAAEFWDTHDTTDYLDAFRTVEIESKFQGRHCEVELDEDVAKALQEQAKRRGETLNDLANELLRRQLATVE